MSASKYKHKRLGNMDEITPLLDDSSAANRHKPLTRLATANQQMPLGETGTSREWCKYGAISNPNTIDEEDSLLRTFQEESDDEVPLEAVVQALCSAWQRIRKPKAEITLDFFTTRELYVMHKAWEKVTRGKRCKAEAHRIAEALANAMATAITPVSPFPSQHLSFVSWNLAFHSDKNLLAVNLLREWKRITEGDDANFPILDDCDNRSLGESARVFGFWQRSAQLCDTIRFLILHIRFQILLHSLLIIWPISILIIATKYADCSVDQSLLCSWMILGVIGCIAIAIRVMLIFSTGRIQDTEALYWRWMGLRFIEFCFLILFIIQAYRFFDTNPPTEPVSDQCMGEFYNSIRKTNYVSIALLLVYLIVYTNKIRLNFFQK